MSKSAFKVLLISYCLCNAAVAQQILQRTVVKGVAIEMKQLMDRSYFVPCVFFPDNTIHMGNYQLDKKLRERSFFEDPHTGFIYQNGIVLGDQSSFYVNSHLYQTIDGGGTSVALEGFGISKYDMNGKKLWFKELQHANRGMTLSISSLAYVRDSLKCLYIDTFGVLNLQTLTKDGDSITTRSLNTNGMRNGHLVPFQKNKLVGVYYTDTFGVAGNRKVRLLILDNDGNLLVNNAIFPDSMNSFCGNMEVIHNEIFLSIFIHDTLPLRSNQYILKLDSNGNMLKSIRLGTFTTGWSGVEATAVSKDGALYISVSNNNGAGVITCGVYKYDTKLNRKWSYSFDGYIYGLDSAGCNGVGFVKSYGNSHPDYQSEVIVFRDPDLPDDCSRCEVTAFPNPTTDGIITFKSHHPDVLISKTDWYDNAGRYVWSMTSESDAFLLNQNQLAAGEYYTISTCDNDKTAQRRIFILR